MDIITQHLAADIDSKLCLPLLYKTFLTVTSDECVIVLKECVLVVCVMIRDNDTVPHMPRYTSTINCGYLVASPQTSCHICKSMPLKNLFTVCWGSFGATITKFQLTIPTSGKLCGAKFKVKL